MSPEPRRLTIVVPCYNEEARLPAERFATWAAAHPEAGFVFVDDGSRDRTAERLEALATRIGPRAEVLRLPANMGKAEAVRAGMRRALDAGAPLAGYFDADLATPLEELELFRAELDARPEALLAMGSRVKLLGRAVERTALRHYPGRIFATCASLVLGLGVYDTQCGAKIFRNTEEVRALFAEPFCVGWTFDVELLARLVAGRRRAGAPLDGCIVEIPLRRWAEVGTSNVKPRDFFLSLLELWRIRRRYAR